MPSYHLMGVAEQFRGYRASLDKAGRELFDNLIYELAGRREETVVMHSDHTEAVMMNILVQMEMRVTELERNNSFQDGS